MTTLLLAAALSKEQVHKLRLNFTASRNKIWKLVDELFWEMKREKEAKQKLSIWGKVMIISHVASTNNIDTFSHS